MSVRYRNGHRRRELRKRVLAHYTHCHLCNQPIDKSLHYLHPYAGEVDEIHPVSLGGNDLAWDNVRLAHRIGNQRRGNLTVAQAQAADVCRPPGTQATQHPARAPLKPTTSRDWLRGGGATIT